MKPALILVALIPLGAPAFGQSFTCRIGQDAACLDWGDTVCSSSGMCVDANAACFEPYQCDYKGFTCKSNVDDCVEAHDRLARDYNDLLQDYETLRAAGEDLNEDYDRLWDRVQDAESCLVWADTLADAKACLD